MYAKILFEKGLHKECIPALTESIRLTPLGEKHLDLGISHLSIGDTAKAVTNFKKASNMLPGHITPVYYLFSIYKDDLHLPDSAVWYARKLVNMDIKKETTHTQSIRNEAARYLHP